MALCALALAFLLAGLRHLGLRGDYRVFFSAENPELAAFDAFQATFTRDDGLLIVLRPAGGDVFEPAVLRAVAEVTAAAWQLPFATRVDSLTNFQSVRAEGDELIVEDLVGDAERAAGLDAAALATIRARAFGEPRLVGRLLADDGAVTAVFVTTSLDTRDPAAFAKVADAVRDLAARTEASTPGLAVDLTGIVMLNHAFLEATLRDVRVLMPWVLVAVIAMVGAFVRSWPATLAVTAVVLGAAAGGLGAAGWAGLELTAPSALAPTLILTLAVAGGMHLAMGVRSAAARAAQAGAAPYRDAIVHALERHGKPIFLTSLTTAIGFWSMRASEAPPCRDLGTITAFGVVVAFAGTMTALPALLAVLPAPRSALRPSRLGGYLERWVLGAARRPRRTLGLAASVLIVALVGLPRNALDDRFIAYFDQRIPFRGASERTVADLTGLYQVEYALRADGPGGIADPAYLHLVDRFARWWRTQPEVVHVRTLVDTVTRLNRAVHGDDPAFDVVPVDPQLAAQNLLLYELSLPYGLDLLDEIDLTKETSRVTVTVGDVTAAELRAVAARGEAWLDREAPAKATPGVGPAVMFAHLTRRSITSMLISTGTALVLISACLVVALRSLRYGLLSLAPNLLPAAVGFGLWGLAVGQVGFGLSIVSAMTLGIVVDDTVHLLSRYLDMRRLEGLDPEDALRATVRAVGPALVATTAVLVVGFALLATSPFAQNRDMGRLSALVLVIALLADLFVLPTLLLITDRAGATASDAPRRGPAVPEEVLP